MRFTSATSHSRGFTLIEVLVISPLIILLIGSIVYFLTTLTGDSLRAREKNAVAYDVQSGLDGIESFGAISTGFPATTGALPAPLGNGTGSNPTNAFLTTSNVDYKSDVLIMNVMAANKNPLSPTREIVYRNTSGNCSIVESAGSTTPTYMLVYFVRDGALWKRTVRANGPSNVNICSSSTLSWVWYRLTCTSSNVGTGVCVVPDEKLASGVTNFKVTYYNSPSGNNTSSVRITPTNLVLPADANPLTSSYVANTIRVELEASRDVAGESVSYSSSTLVTSINLLASQIN